MFQCVKCNKEFKLKHHFSNHLARKTSCIKEEIKCDRCFQIFQNKRNLTNHQNRKFPCEKVDLQKENAELKHQLEIAKLKASQQITNITNNIMINNFGDEEISKIKGKILNEGLNKIINSIQYNTPNNYMIEDFSYTNKDIRDIDTFRLFVRLIFNNNSLPQNRTIRYDDVNDVFYYKTEDAWIPLEEESNTILIDMIFEKIKLLIIDKRVLIEDNLRELEFYIGDNYSIRVVDYAETIKDVKIHPDDKPKFTKILKLEYKKKFELKHMLNISS